MTKHYTKVHTPKPYDSLTNRPITLNQDWEAFLTGWISDKMSEGLELTHTLPPYITVYRKGKSIDDLTLNHIMFLEDTQQLPYDISAALSDDVEKCFDRITTETKIVVMMTPDTQPLSYYTSSFNRHNGHLIGLGTFPSSQNWGANIINVPLTS